MGPFLAMFNCHCGDAKYKATVSFMKKYGRATFNREILPFIKKGIMPIFHEPPNEWRQFFVDRVTEFVNAGLAM